MKEILFRGKCIITDKWYEGDYFRLKWENGIVSHYLYVEKNRYYKVEIYPETVGMFTGHTDKNGTKIFDGDILKTYGGEYVVVTFTNTQFILKKKNGRSCTWQYVHNHEVVGNIYDNDIKEYWNE